MGEAKLNLQVKYLVKERLRAFALGLLTLGIYVPHGTYRKVKLYTEHIIISDKYKLALHCTKYEYFSFCVKWFCLSIVTLGILGMTFKSRTLSFFIDHLVVLENDVVKYRLKSKVTNHFAYFWKVVPLNLLNTICLGFYTPYKRVKILKYIAEKFIKITPTERDEKRYILSINCESNYVDYVAKQYYVNMGLTILTLGFYIFVAERDNASNLLYLCNFS